MFMLEQGKIYHLKILHDNWCPKLRGGTCVCSPDYKMEEVPDPDKFVSEIHFN